MRPSRLAVVLLLVLAACGGPPSSPAEAFAAVRAALESSDGAALYAVTDDDSMAYHRAQVRELRGLLDRGDDPAEVLKSALMTAAEVRRGTEADAVALMLSRRSPLVAEAKWYLAATVVAEETETPSTARIRLRGPDGTERDMWFVAQRGGWRYDHYRSTRNP